MTVIAPDLADGASTVRLGALCWNQYTDWPGLLEAGGRADRLGFDTLWTWDHLYPILGSSDGPILEGYLTLAGWAMTTKHVRLGLMVGANPYREPALTAKMVTTLDHLSGGRAILGIGAAWNEEEALDFGIPFGSGPGERLRWLGEALPIMRGMLQGAQPTASGPRYAAHSVRNDPSPLQEKLPILIGGGGEKVTLRLVARFADANNLGGALDDVRRKEQILVRHCEEVGRDPTEIERTVGLGITVIRDSESEAQRALLEIGTRNGHAERRANHLVGTPETVAERLAAYVDLGYGHLIAGFPSPYDEESMTRLATEVRTLLEAH